MSDWDNIVQDALYEEEQILQANRQIEEVNYDDAKRLKRTAKINLQPAIVQKYWLGRLVYELAIRNEEVKKIKREASKLTDTIDHYNSFSYSPREKFLTLKLHPYGFTAQPEENMLQTSHTSYPTRLEHYKYGYIEINTWKKVEKLLTIVDGNKTAKQLNMNTKNYSTWSKIGKSYINNYFELLDINLYSEDKVLTSDYEPLASKLQDKPTSYWEI